MLFLKPSYLIYRLKELSIRVVIHKDINTCYNNQFYL